jgi:hypothetical protein
VLNAHHPKSPSAALEQLPQQFRALPCNWVSSLAWSRLAASALSSQSR